DEGARCAGWVARPQASQPPKPGASRRAEDRSADPPVQLTKSMVQKAGIKTVYSHISPAEVPDYAPAADNVAATHADVVVLGSTDVPTVNAFVKAFQQQHYTPKIFIAAAGPDQGNAFTSAVGVANASGILVPNAWYGGAPHPERQEEVVARLEMHWGQRRGHHPGRARALFAG